MERIAATYHIETPYAPEQVGLIMAGEQSTGTFVSVPGETDALKQSHGARLEKIVPLDDSQGPSLPSPKIEGERFQRAKIVLSWPVENMGHNLMALISTLQGNLYELRQLTGIKLMDIHLPAGFTKAFSGPTFGAIGSRRRMGVAHGPMIGTIIKPSVGLSPTQTAEQVRQLIDAGIDFIKDDELTVNPPHAPLVDRVEAVMAVINQHADRVGRKIMYAFHISDELDAMKRHYECLIHAGASCAMLSVNSLGPCATKAICDLGELPIHGHRNGWGMLNRHPWLGIAFPAYQVLWRLAGVDQLHVNGLSNKFWEEDASVVASMRACASSVIRPMSLDTTAQPPSAASNLREDAILPVVSSGQWGGQACETFAQTQTTDLLYLAGGGIMAHPKGVAAGVHAIRQWWHAACEGLNIPEAIMRYPELELSYRTFGASS